MHTNYFLFFSLLVFSTASPLRDCIFLSNDRRTRLPGHHQLAPTDLPHWPGSVCAEDCGVGEKGRGHIHGFSKLPSLLQLRGLYLPIAAGRSWRTGPRQRGTKTRAKAHSLVQKHGCSSIKLGAGPIDKIQRHGAAAGAQSEFSGSRSDILHLEHIIQDTPQHYLSRYPVTCLLAGKGYLGRT
jgi:hypothetical protein